MRTYYEGPVDAREDVHLRGQYFTYRTDAGLVAGADFSVMFSLDRSARDVWPHFKDFNRWQNPHSHYYSGVIGDLEGKAFALGVSPDDLGPHRYNVVKVIPEYLIVIHQPVPKGGAREAHLPGLGCVDGGFQVFMLNEHERKTVVTGLMEHASLMERTGQVQGMTVEEALGPWRDHKMVPEWVRKWRDDFIPTLKKVVRQAR